MYKGIDKDKANTFIESSLMGNNLFPPLQQRLKENLEELKRQ
ncbi:MAG: hypothetical protein OCC46_04045 [Pseudodesulfovibrio sp.]